jgi:V/A-type H+-transporting ATPase subunit K
MSRKRVLASVALAIMLAAGGGTLVAQEQPTSSTTQPAATAARPARSGVAVGLIAVGAGLAVGLAALGTGIAQSRIGAAGSGTIAEKPEMVGTVILLVAIPETMVILGFVIAIVMLFTL